LGSHKTGLHVYFPGVVLTVDTSSDCHLSYEPLGKTTALSSLHYVQPRCPPVVYPSKRLAFLARTRSQSRQEQAGGVLVDGQPDAPSPHPVVSFQLTFIFLLVLLLFSRLFPGMILPVWFIGRVPPSPPFAPVTGLTVPTRRLIGLPKNFIGLWDAVVSATTSTSSNQP
jgi:hypothetical protein